MIEMIIELRQISLKILFKDTILLLGTSTKSHIIIKGPVLFQRAKIILRNYLYLRDWSNIGLISKDFNQVGIESELLNVINYIIIMNLKCL